MAYFSRAKAQGILLHVLYVFGDVKLQVLAKSRVLTFLNSPATNGGHLERVEAQNEGGFIFSPVEREECQERLQDRSLTAKALPISRAAVLPLTSHLTSLSLHCCIYRVSRWDWMATKVLCVCYILHFSEFQDDKS